jgi:long-chain acyl-CoA synthetase
VKEQGEKQGLKKREIPKYIHMTHDKWIPESGLVTPTQKLKRKTIEMKYKEQIEQLYHQ